MNDVIATPGVKLARLSAWIDRAPRNAARNAEARTWGRVAKVSEEAGEVIAEMIAATGQNPRKEPHEGYDLVKKELLDVAVTALAAYEHLTGNGDCMEALDDHLTFLLERVGLEPD